MEKERKKLFKTAMEKAGTAITGLSVKIKDIDPMQGVGYSMRDKAQAEIGLAFDYPFKGLTAEEAEVILYGIYTHEVLHLLRTDFDYEQEKMAEYPAREQGIRHEIANLIEDPAIEYLLSDLISDRMKNCLKRSIGYFYKNAPDIEDECNHDAFEQFICAVIQFGDIGILKGTFTFPEAREAFIACASMITRAIEEPEFEKRYSISQEVFEVIRPLWEEHEQRVYANSELKELLDRFGKGSSTGQGKPVDHGAPEPDAEDNAASERRKRTVRIISEGQAGQLESGQGANPDGNNSGDNSPVPGQDKGIHEGENSCAKETECIQQDSADKGNGLGEIEDIQRILMEEADLSEDAEITQEDIKGISEIIQAASSMKKAEEKKQEKKKKAEDSHVEVRSPYYKDVQYIVHEVEDYDEDDYGQLCSTLSSYIINLRSQLKKIFNDPHVRKEYRTSGKFDPKRASGRKMTARLFTRKTMPENRKDLSIVILLDESGSMGKSIFQVKKACIMLLEALDGFGIPVKVIGFESCNSVPHYYHYGKWDNNKAMRRRIMRMSARRGTFLGHAIRYAGSLLKRRPERHKIFIVMTDGEPNSRFYKNWNDGMNDCRYAVMDIRKYAEVIGIGLYDTEDGKNVFQFIFGDGSVSMSDFSGLLRELPRKIKKILERY